MSRTRVWLFGLTLAAYVAIVVGVLTTSKLVTLDWQVMLWRPYKQWPQIHAFLDYFVVLGQRGPTAVMVLAWLGWRAWRHRTLHPLLVLGTSLLLLNITVGAVKYGLGRLGPHYATEVGSAEMFAGGDIFPSGHTANAVVTWGVLAYLATTPRARRLGSVVSAFLALGVGATTVYLGTHWVSDVLLGWAAGLLILLALPWFEPAMARAEEFITAGWERLRERRRSRAALVPLPAPALVAQRDTPQEDEPGRETAGAGSLGTAAPAVVGSGPANVAAQPVANAAHAPSRPPTGRGERTPPSPAGSRRPPVDRQFRPPPPLVHQQVRGRGIAG
ncbi:phosphatase PAP2 family protein [Streptomyces sp. HPF1205]|uniref:phosphatase PAP2 family protein n=1 Tax=Streptomyces sp. HPF1205 TaxID=2873262 RepID=UPI001CEC791D|nr:phosphatase PAP2 family protein [Streptomyces sp. HPF1205]